MGDGDIFVGRKHCLSIYLTHEILFTTSHALICLLLLILTQIREDEHAEEYRVYYFDSVCFQKNSNVTNIKSSRKISHTILFSYISQKQFYIYVHDTAIQHFCLDQD